MPLLGYCISEILPSAQTLSPGVGGLGVENLDAAGLRCFISASNRQDQFVGPSLRDAALKFHNVLENIFQQTAIIPFRFPTIFSGEEEMLCHLNNHSQEYLESLTRLRHMIQMELRIKFRDPGENPIRAVGAEVSAKTSGTGYLHKIKSQNALLNTAAKNFRARGSQWISDWRQSYCAQGIRIFALLERGSVADFKTAMAGMRTPSEITSQLSGPWPATAFLEPGQEQKEKEG